jgi:hypothetical protein
MVGLCPNSHGTSFDQMNQRRRVICDLLLILKNVKSSEIYGKMTVYNGSNCISQKWVGRFEGGRMHVVDYACSG